MLSQIAPACVPVPVPVSAHPQYFHPDIRPWVHYIPVDRADIDADLPAKVSGYPLVVSPHDGVC